MEIRILPNRSRIGKAYRVVQGTMRSSNLSDQRKFAVERILGEFDTKALAQRYIDSFKENPVDESGQIPFWGDQKNPGGDIHRGDVVMYSRHFLQSTGMYTGDVPFAQGKVTSIDRLGGSRVANVEWNIEGLPARVAVRNLIRRAERHLEHNPPDGIVDPDDLRPKVVTGLRGRVPQVLVNNAVIAARILLPWIGHAEVEYKAVMYLNTKLKLIGMENVSKGTLDATIWHPREIFTGAVRMRAASIITAHNHPSGDPMPSTYDDEAYKKIVAAGEVMGIRVMDNLILGRDVFYCYSTLEVARYD